jgi:hypothetical protein
MRTKKKKKKKLFFCSFFVLPSSPEQNILYKGTAAYDIPIVPTARAPMIMPMLEFFSRVDLEAKRKNDRLISLKDKRQQTMISCKEPPTKTYKMSILSKSEF